MPDNKPSEAELDKYLSGAPSEKDLDSFLGSKAPQLIDQPHPDQEKFFKDRWLIANFGGTPQDQVDYLKLKHSAYDFQANKAGDIFLKKKSESDYKALNPSGWQGFGELGRDVTDHTAKILQGLGMGVGAGLGTVFGPVGTGVGGALTGGGLETIKQKIGNELGVRKDYNGKDIAIQTALGLIPVAGQAVSKVLGPTAEELAIELAPNKFQLPGPPAPGIYEKALEYVKNPKTWKNAAKIGAGALGIKYLSKH